MAKKLMILAVLLLIQNEYIANYRLLVDFQLNTQQYMACPYETFEYLVRQACSKEFTLDDGRR